MGKKIFKIVGVLLLDLIIIGLCLGFALLSCAQGFCDTPTPWWEELLVVLIPIGLIIFTGYAVYRILRKKK